uniref:Cysteine-rich protein 1 n=1 Tax=Astyanax mexicanus TaxID=7994 RepID=A0A3B1J6F8_ASTMX
MFSAPERPAASDGEKKRSLGRDYHPLCLKCHKCKRQLTPGQHAEHDEKPYCTNCYMRDFGPRGENSARSDRGFLQQMPQVICLSLSLSLSLSVSLSFLSAGSRGPVSRTCNTAAS